MAATSAGTTAASGSRPANPAIASSDCQRVTTRNSIPLPRARERIEASTKPACFRSAGKVSVRRCFTYLRACFDCATPRHCLAITLPSQEARENVHCPAGGCQSSTLLPSGSMTHPNFPYSESSVFSSTLQPSAQRPKQGGQVLDTVVDHEGRLAWSEVTAICCTDGPDRGSRGRVSRGIGPGEGCATPVLDVNAQVRLVPSTQRVRILGAEENAADARDSLHFDLRSRQRNERSASGLYP